MEYYGTLGPQCSEERTIMRMLEAGMTGVRLNLSHGGLKENEDRITLFRDCASRYGIRPEILIDLQGPEIRIGRLKNDIDALEGSVIRMSGESPDRLSNDVIPIPKEAEKAMEPGDRILLDDGKLEFSCISRDEDGILASVLRGGVIRSSKSLAIVGKEIDMPVLKEQDIENIRLAHQYGVTGVMQPFVRRKEDLIELRDTLKKYDQDEIRIFAKIETLKGAENLDELIPYADVIVIARGDLGNSMPLYKLPGVQKRIAARCRKEEKSFMVVTQMLDSMMERAVPTRAEVLDIYNAVLDGASSLMLTGETAAGRYPAEAMDYLVRTAEEALTDPVVSDPRV